ncbi:MAG: hypothetical protein IT368_06825 [Candidatus Hydrogenedentes bacterium]|nr:hypothetical protein [Candidatus Hydrogenedentota bacterium]
MFHPMLSRTYVFFLAGLLSGCAMSPAAVDTALMDAAEPVRPHAAVSVAPQTSAAGQVVDPRQLAITLTVTWDGEVPWEGTAPTSRIYDLTIMDGGDEIWRWSDGQAFAQAITPISVPARGALSYTEVWTAPADLPPGTYTVTGYFVPAQAQASAQIHLPATR